MHGDPTPPAPPLPLLEVDALADELVDAAAPPAPLPLEVLALLLEGPVEAPPLPLLALDAPPAPLVEALPPPDPEGAPDEEPPEA